jgi:protein tyrosine phosphatase (PTP) superfamily phosphohydrolase (DUF442 family)
MCLITDFFCGGRRLTLNPSLLESITFGFVSKNFKSAHTLFFVVILNTLIFFAPQAVLAGSPSQEAPTKIAIANFDCVSESIWRGAAPSDRALHQLAHSGVRTIIDLRMSKSNCRREAQTAQQLGLNYIHLPMGFKSPTYVDVTQFLKIVSDPGNLPVFIHCHQGADRTGVLVGIYRVLVENWSYENTYNEMRSHHFKPWLFTMKRSVIAVSKNELVRHSLQTAVDDSKVSVIDSSEI